MNFITKNICYYQQRAKVVALLFFCATSFWLSAQCEPDTSRVNPGMYPDSSEHLPFALVGFDYSERITAVVVKDTAVDLGFGTPVMVTIQHIEILAVDGMPQNFVYECNPPDCKLPGGESSCILLYSTQAPSMVDTGIYPLEIRVKTVASTPFGTQSQLDTLRDFFIGIFDSAEMSVKKVPIKNSTLSLSPNPVIHNLNLRFNTASNGRGILRVYNSLGRLVREDICEIQGGNFEKNYDFSLMDKGIYFVRFYFDNRIFIYPLVKL